VLECCTCAQALVWVIGQQTLHINKHDEGGDRVGHEGWGGEEGRRGGGGGAGREEGGRAQMVDREKGGRRVRARGSCFKSVSLSLSLSLSLTLALALALALALSF